MVLAVRAEQTGETKTVNTSCLFPTNYLIACGLAGYRHTEFAAHIEDKTIAYAIKNEISQHYDSISGKVLDVKDYCMSATLVMMLDELPRKHKLTLRKWEQGRSPCSPPLKKY